MASDTCVRAAHAKVQAQASLCHSMSELAVNTLLLTESNRTRRQNLTGWLLIDIGSWGLTAANPHISDMIREPQSNGMSHPRHRDVLEEGDVRCAPRTGADPLPSPFAARPPAPSGHPRRPATRAARPSATIRDHPRKEPRHADHLLGLIPADHRSLSTVKETRDADHLLGLTLIYEF